MLGRLHRCQRLAIASASSQMLGCLYRCQWLAIASSPCILTNNRRWYKNINRCQWRPSSLAVAAVAYEFDIQSYCYSGVLASLWHCSFCSGVMLFQQALHQNMFECIRTRVLWQESLFGHGAYARLLKSLQISECGGVARRARAATQVSGVSADQ